MTVLGLIALLSILSGLLASGGLWLFHTKSVTALRSTVLIILVAVLPAICAVILLFARHIVLSSTVG